MLFRSTGTLLAVAYSDERVVVYRLVADQVEEAIKIQVFDDVRGLAFSPGGDQLAILQKQGIMGVWDLPRTKAVGPVPGTLVRGWQAHEERGMQLAWSPDGGDVVTVGYGSDRPRAWSLQSAYETRRLTKTARNENDLPFTPDSRFLTVDGKGLERWSLDDFPHFEYMRNANGSIQAGLMNANGVLGSLCFPTFPGFAGQRFQSYEDRGVSLAAIQAYNDWHLEAWCGARGMPRFAAKQLLEWVYGKGVVDVDRMTNLSKAHRDLLAHEMQPTPLT